MRLLSESRQATGPAMCVGSRAVAGGSLQEWLSVRHLGLDHAQTGSGLISWLPTRCPRRCPSVNSMPACQPSQASPQQTQHRQDAKTQPIAARNHTPIHTPERCENRRRRDLGQAYVGGLHRRLPRRPRAQPASHEHMRRVEHLFRHSHICSSSECSRASTR